ncbi:phosphatase PAP2 family protein [Butyrivibrio sp. AE2032]|uniref:phosphatase PAP2 family protein n=1 Tax=Butyrivibrio sp. AE2032 TaxID=1458463 RepID=UPI00068C8A27|nr:phosphatase PAP2 family protein [Butyrivibrio sp. AE2032]
MGWEADFLLYIQEHIRSDVLTPFLTFITHTGDYGLALIIFVVAIVLIPKTRRFGIITAVSIIIETLLTNLVIKNAVARTRPYEVIDGLVCLVGKQKDFSFPSGHSGAAFSVAIALFLIALLGLPVIGENGSISRSKTSTAYKLAIIPVILYAVIIAFSRLYVGVHYPTDVIGGILLGIGSGVIAYFSYHFAIRKFHALKTNGVSHK